MHTIKTGYRGLSLLVDLNWDRMICVGALVLALTAGAWLVSMMELIPFAGHI